MSEWLCVVGQDARQQAAARALRQAGVAVAGPEQAGQAPVLLLPMGAAGARAEVCRAAVQAAAPGALVLAGRPDAALRRLAEQRGLELIDYYARPELVRLNAVPTAEGCLALLLQMRDSTIWQSRFLVLGYGRVGQAVAERLRALGGLVTVAARSAEQRAAARCANCRAAPLTALPRLLPRADAVVNTIPAPVLPAGQLARLRPGAAVVDLASAPGGTDFAAAERLGVRACLAPGLPGRCAPVTAGRLIARTVLNLLNERRAAPDTEE